MFNFGHHRFPGKDSYLSKALIVDTIYMLIVDTYLLTDTFLYADTCKLWRFGTQSLALRQFYLFFSGVFFLIKDQDYFLIIMLLTTRVFTIP